MDIFIEKFSSQQSCPFTVLGFILTCRLTYWSQYHHFFSVFNPLWVKYSSFETLFEIKFSRGIWLGWEFLLVLFHHELKCFNGETFLIHVSLVHHMLFVFADGGWDTSVSYNDLSCCRIRPTYKLFFLYFILTNFIYTWKTFSTIWRCSRSFLSMFHIRSGISYCKMSCTKQELY